MEHIIEGILIKYNEPILDNRMVIKPGAFDEHKVNTIPIFKECHALVPPIGMADLRYEEDGVYYTGRLFDTDESDKIIQKCSVQKMNLSLCANKIKWESDSSRNVIGATPRHMAFTRIFDDTAKIMTIDGKNVDLLRKKATKETKEPAKAEILANLREDIDLLTHDRQPTAEEMKIVNDISAVIAMMEKE